jgi:hypothetical protein
MKAPLFCFEDKGCIDPAIVDDVNSEEYNIDTRATLFVKYFKSMSAHY